MFGFLRRRKVVKVAPRKVTLRLEQLETRFCPAAPVIGSLSVHAMSGHMVSIDGTVSDEHPESVYVAISGVVSGTTYPNSAGAFSLLAIGDVPGRVDAKGLDDENLWSAAKVANLSVAQPTVALGISACFRNSVTFAGTLTDLDPGSLQVTFSGAVTGTTMVDSSGHYLFTPTSATLGDVQVTTTNLWGIASNTPSATISTRIPVIKDFAANKMMGNTYQLQGSVDDEDPAGMVVNFSGLASANGQTATVGINGTFSAWVTFAAGETGIVKANTADWWGEAATTAQTLVV